MDVQLGSLRGTWGIVIVYSLKYRFLFLYTTGNSLQTFARLLMSIEDCRQNMVGVLHNIITFLILNIIISHYSHSHTHSLAQYQWGCCRHWRTSGKSRFRRSEMTRRGLTEPQTSTTENCRIIWAPMPRRKTYLRYGYYLHGLNRVWILSLSPGWCCHWEGACSLQADCFWVCLQSTRCPCTETVRNYRTSEFVNWH